MSDLRVFPVQRFNYAALVKKLAQAGQEKMPKVLDSELRELPKADFEAEREYFWKALHNAARQNTAVWLWFVTQFSQFDTGNGLHIDPKSTSDWQLPEIDPNGEKIDWEAEAEAEQKNYPSEPTEENFLLQAAALEQYFKENTQPEDKCHNINEYVATLAYPGGSSGTGKMSAKMQLAAAGFRALATDQGINWLIKNYGPKEDIRRSGVN